MDIVSSDQWRSQAQGTFRCLNHQLQARRGGDDLRGAKIRALAQTIDVPFICRDALEQVKACIIEIQHRDLFHTGLAV